MAQTREIEKLQRRWQENPLGLTFAPLAEAFRKEGMFADALELLEIGLSQHPNYVPAHIVRGRCFMDVEQDQQAEGAFFRVTELDPENAIALKGLADISERGGRYPEALALLDRLLDFDRSNEDALVQLDRVRAALAAPVPDSEVPPVVAEPVVGPEPVVAALAPAPAPEPEISTEALLDTWLGAEPEPTPVAESPKAEILAADVEVSVYQPLELASAPDPEFEMPNDAESPRAAEAPGAVDEWLGEFATAPLEPNPASAAEPVLTQAATGPAPEMREPAEAAEGSEDPDAGDSDLVVTETMAEVFLRQGHRELALAVYSQLLTRDPTNGRIRSAAERLETELRPAGGAPALPAYAAVLTGGQSVRSFFESLLLSTRPGAPGRTSGALSLGAVFGDERSAADVSLPAPSGAESFDEFFAGAPAGGAAPESGEPVHQSADPVEDIEEFNSWLKGLKR